MILIQYITLEWCKDCRGGLGAIQRSQFPKAVKLPTNFLDYSSFGKPIHLVRIRQKIDNFHIKVDRRKIEEFNTQNSLRLSPMELIPKENDSCEIRYIYNWHMGAMPQRYKYTYERNYVPLNELAFELSLGDYGRAICNGRFVGCDTGTWWYEMSIVNVMVLQEKNVSLNCFLANTPTHYYYQLAQLY